MSHTLFAPEQLERFAKVANRDVSNVRKVFKPSHASVELHECTAVICLAEVAFFIEPTEFAQVVPSCEAVQLVMSSVVMPLMEGEINVKWVELKEEQYIIQLRKPESRHSSIFWWFRAFFKSRPLEITFSPPPFEESVTLERADILVREGKLQDAVNLVYEKLDDSLRANGPSALNKIIGALSPEILSSQVLLALITIAGMAREDLPNWNGFLQRLSASDAVLNDTVLRKVVKRLMDQGESSASKCIP